MADYIKLQNAGSILSDINLLKEMINSSDEYRDSNGYFSKKNVAKIAVASLIITSAGKVGIQDLLQYIDNETINETDNPILQNTKLIMQNMRMLGLVSTDYNSETYALTEMAHKVVEQFFPSRSTSLLLELFMNINTTTEVYEHFCTSSFACYIGYGICYAFSKLNYRIAVHDMPILTTYSIEEIDSFVQDTKTFRKSNICFPDSHDHYPKTRKGNPIKNPSNLTRKINQLLKYCGIIEQKTKIIKGINYYVCTPFGRAYVDRITKNFNKYKFVSAHDFRKQKYDDQKKMVLSGLLNLYKRSGIDKEKGNRDDYVIFSPFQMIPETNINWLLGRPINKPPENSKLRATVINSQITKKELRIKAIYQQGIVISSSPQFDPDIVDYIQENKRKGKNVDTIAEGIVTLHQNEEKEQFYPFVHSLLKIIGIQCEGEVGRYDAYCKYNNHIIPFEVKTYTETHTYNMKGIRQAIENKITSYDSSLQDNMNYASFVIGYQNPKNVTSMINIIETAYEKWKIKIVCSTLKKVEWI